MESLRVFHVLSVRTDPNQDEYANPNDGEAE